MNDESEAHSFGMGSYVALGRKNEALDAVAHKPEAGDLEDQL